MVTSCLQSCEPDHDPFAGVCVCEVIGRVGPVKAIDLTERYGISVLIDNYWPEFNERELTIVERGADECTEESKS